MQAFHVIWLEPDSDQEQVYTTSNPYFAATKRVELIRRGIWHCMQTSDYKPISRKGAHMRNGDEGLWYTTEATPELTAHIGRNGVVLFCHDTGEKEICWSLCYEDMWQAKLALRKIGYSIVGSNAPNWPRKHCTFDDYVLACRDFFLDVNCLLKISHADEDTLLRIKQAAWKVDAIRQDWLSS